MALETNEIIRAVMVHTQQGAPVDTVRAEKTTQPDRVINMVQTVLINQTTITARITTMVPTIIIQIHITTVQVPTVVIRTTKQEFGLYWESLVSLL